MPSEPVSMLSPSPSPSLSAGPGPAAATPPAVPAAGRAPSSGRRGARRRYRPRHAARALPAISPRLLALPAVLLATTGSGLVGLSALPSSSAAAPAPSPAPVAVEAPETTRLLAAARAQSALQLAPPDLAGLVVPPPPPPPPPVVAPAPKPAPQPAEEAAAPAETAPARAGAPRASRSGRTEEVAAGAYVRPTTGGVTSGFGPRWGRQHKGLDFGAPAGTPIRSVTGGVVRSAGYDGGYGNQVTVEHADGTVTAYAHMSKILARSGAKVAAGETIGLVGTTGSSTGNHLHFEVRTSGGAVDPRSWLAKRGVDV